jgi:hypothetical protein
LQYIRVSAVADATPLQNRAHKIESDRIREDPAAGKKAEDNLLSP